MNKADSVIVPQRTQLYRHCLLPLLVWSALVGASLFYALRIQDEATLAQATAEGRAVFRLMEATRIWNAEQGGIYVRQSERAPPNPYISESKRTVTTNTGKALTLLNPAYMTRQLSQVIDREAGIRLHMTSLKLVNPANQADAWETRALQDFGRGTRSEAIQFDTAAKIPLARYMAPLYTVPSCLACHSGYKLGEVRGGLSVQWSVAPLVETMRDARRRTLTTHGITWLLVSALLFMSIRQLRNNLSTIAQSQASLSTLNAELEATVQARTRQLDASMQKLKTISDRAPGIVYQYMLRPDGSTAIPYANDNFHAIFGLHPDEVRKDASRLYDCLHPDDVADFISSTQRSARDLTPWRHEFRIHDSDGRERWLFGNTVPQRQANGLTLWNGFITDITQRKQAEAETRQHKIIIDAAQDGFWMVDKAGYLSEVNQAYADMTGYTTAELLKMHIDELEAPDQSEDIKTHIENLFSIGHEVFETRHLHKDGHQIDVEMSATFLHESKTFFVFCRDITKRKQMERTLRESEERFRHLADYDVLTKLPNRRLLVDRLESAMAASRRSGCYGAMIFLDLDNFKPLNDLHGHDAGDLLLLEVANRLKSSIREVDTVARLGGDEFVVVLSELNCDAAQSAHQARMIAEKIRASLAQPYVFTLTEEGEKVTHHCSASLGIALFLDREHSHEEIFKRADNAMYQAKKSGRNQICFSEEAENPASNSGQDA